MVSVIESSALVLLACSVGLAFLVCGRAIAETPDTPPGMAYVPGGVAKMGLSETQVKDLAQAAGMHPSLFPAPERQVEIRPFFLDKFEVTYVQYAAFLEATGRSLRGQARDARVPEDMKNKPVAGITIEDAKAFAAWAGKRLPTEDEWEWAARGAEGRLYPWGGAWKENAANTWGAQLYGPAPVGAFPADLTPQGVFDMAGNVSEYTASYYGPEKQVHPVIVIRGGNWLTTHTINAAAFNRNFSSYQQNSGAAVGFRCALDVDAPAPKTLPQPGPGAPKVDEEYKKFFFTPEAEPDQPITVAARPGARSAHSIEINVPDLAHAPFGLQFPEAVVSNRDVILCHEYGQDVQISSGQDNELVELLLAKPNEDFQYRARAEVHGDRVDLTLRFKNLGDTPWEHIRAQCCLSPGFANGHLADPEHRRTYIMTEAGVQPLCAGLRGQTGRPQYRGICVRTDQWPDTYADYGGEAVANTSAIGLTSRDRQWTYVKVFEDAVNLVSNSEYSCIHSTPHFASISPGEERVVRGAIFFLRMPPDKALPYAWEKFVRIINKDLEAAE